MRFILIVVLLVLPFSSPAPVIYGNVQTITSNAVPSTLTRLTFVPRNTPLSTIPGDAVILDYTSVTNIWTGGWFTNTLVGGMYDVKFTASKLITILVPTNGGPYTFSYVAQLATNAPVFSYPSILGLPTSMISPGTNVSFLVNNPGNLNENIVISGPTALPYGIITNPPSLTQTVLASGVTNLTVGQRTIPTVYAYLTNIILLGYNGADSTHSDIYYGAVTPGVSFKIFSGNATDTNRVSWAIIHP